jgi:hypothetical protein
MCLTFRPLGLVAANIVVSLAEKRCSKMALGSAACKWTTSGAVVMSRQHGSAPLVCPLELVHPLSLLCQTHVQAVLHTSCLLCCCSKIAEAEAVVSVNEKKVVSDACVCANAARRGSGPPKPAVFVSSSPITSCPVPGQFVYGCRSRGTSL